MFPKSKLYVSMLKHMMKLQYTVLFSCDSCQYIFLTLPESYPQMELKVNKQTNKYASRYPNKLDCRPPGKAKLLPPSCGPT